MRQIHQQDRYTRRTAVKTERDGVSSNLSPHLRALRTLEVWHQLPEDPALWHGPHGVIVNNEALEERKRFFALIRIRASTPGAGD